MRAALVAGLLLVALSLGAVAVVAVSWYLAEDGSCDYFYGLEYSYQRHAVRLANGSFACVYVDANGDDLDLAYGSYGTWAHVYGIDEEMGNDSETICVERVPEFDFGDGTREAIVVLWASLVEVDVYNIAYVLIDTSNWATAAHGYLYLTDTNDQVDPYVTVQSSGYIWAVFAMSVGDPAEYHIFMTSALPEMSGPGSMGWCEEVEAALYVTEDDDERWPCLAVDREDTLHMTYSTDIGGDWFLIYVNMTLTEFFFDDRTSVFDTTVGDQVYGSLVVANLTYGGLPRDCLVVGWVNGSMFDSDVVVSGMWVGDRGFWDYPREVDNDSTAVSLGTWGNYVMCVYAKYDRTYELYYASGMYPGTDIVTGPVEGQDPEMAYFWPCMVWSYWGGRDRYAVFVQEMSPPMGMACSAGPQYIPESESDVFYIDLYTETITPPGGGGPGGGGGGGGGGGSQSDEGKKSACCSSAALGIIPVASLCMVWSRRKKR